MLPFVRFEVTIKVMSSAVAEPPVSAPKLFKGGRIPSVNIDWDAAREMRKTGKSFEDVAKALNCNKSTLGSGFSRRGWTLGGLVPQKSGKFIPTSADSALDDPLAVETFKKMYLARVAKLLVEDGVNILMRERPRTPGKVMQVFRSLGEIHAVAKDIFSIGKDSSGPQTIVNIGLLADPSKGAKMAINVQNGPTIFAPIEVPSEVVQEAVSGP